MLLGLVVGGLAEAFKSGFPAHGFDLHHDRRNLVPQGAAESVGYGEIAGEALNRPLIASGSLKEEAERPRKRLLDCRTGRADPVGRDQLVLIRQHGAVALEVGHDGQRLVLVVVNAEDHESRST